MKTRTITAIIALPFLIVPIMLGGIWVNILCFLISIVGTVELYKAYKITNKGIVALTAIVISAYYLLMMLYGNKYLTFLIAFFVLGLLICFVFSYPKLDFAAISMPFFSFFYLTFLISHIVLTRNTSPVGGVFIWLIFLIGFGSDTFAYIFGRTMGKKKLAKNLSPNKTVEGFFGGIIGATILTAIYAYIMMLQDALPTNFSLLFFIGLGAVGAVLSVLGDLTASAIKRQTGIKDFGHLLPGHGGIMDRFDSNIFTAPFIYYSMVLWMNLFQA